ncbi:hypothetical protein N7492_006179 [Penicillium capsulatum]|uniref:Uncharacterized protein n=1 Tax=Penicillium capsulatum TaxID=69766 RepID=A0A9W9I3G0_9EURO|nr:hypothetical protein N7492_006179 [Penicillium capsulatum]
MNAPFVLEHLPQDYYEQSFLVSDSEMSSSPGPESILDMRLAIDVDSVLDIDPDLQMDSTIDVELITDIDTIMKIDSTLVPELTPRATINDPMNSMYMETDVFKQYGIDEDEFFAGLHFGPNGEPYWDWKDANGNLSVWAPKTDASPNSLTAWKPIEIDEDAVSSNPSTAAKMQGSIESTMEWAGPAPRQGKYDVQKMATEFHKFLQAPAKVGPLGQRALWKEQDLAENHKSKVK